MTSRLSSLLLAVSASLFAVVTSACDSQPVEAGSTTWSVSAATEALAPTQPLIADGRVFAAYGRQFSAVDASDGTVLWTAPIQLFGGSSAGAVLDGGDVVFLNYLTWVKAFRKSDGRVLWTAPLDEAGSIDRTLLVQNGSHLFLGRRGEAVRIRKPDGVVDLRLDLTPFVPEGVDHLVYNVALSPDGRTLYVPTGFYIPDAATTAGYVFAFDAVSGDLVWSFFAPEQSSPIPGGGEVPVGTAVYGLGVSSEVVVAPVGQTVYALDSSDGDVIWERFFETDGFDEGATVEGGAVYVGSLLGHVYRMDLAAGTVTWRATVSGSLSTRLVVEDGRIFFTSPFEGSAWILDTSDGSLVARVRPDGDLLLAPIAVGERILVSASSTKLYAMERPR